MKNMPQSDIGNSPDVQRINIRNCVGMIGQIFYVDDMRLLIAPYPFVFKIIQTDD